MRKLLNLLFLLTPLAAISQTDGSITVQAGMPNGDIQSLPATMELIPKSPEAHPGKIWIRSSDEGLHIWGKIQTNDNDLHWPTQRSEMLSSDHVEIWLSTTSDVEMPPVGYGNQFGENDLKSPADCRPLENMGGPGGPRNPHIKDCERWYNEQLEYRKSLERLFTRQWLAAGDEPSRPMPSKALFEDFATTAWASLNASLFEDDLPKPLEPRANGGVVSEFNTEYGKPITEQTAGGESYQRNVVTGYRFHFFIPWSAFPPAQQLNLRDLWLMVDVFGTAPEGKKMGALSTTSAVRVWGKPSSFNHLVLDAPRDYEISPCHAAGTEEDMYGDPHRAWYFPLAGKGPLYLRTVYDLENPAAGYMYDPTDVSPIFKATDHFWKVQPDGAAVCGPQLEYRKGEVAKTSQFYVSKEYFATRPLADGWTLVRSGPDMSTQSAFGSGACGACPVVDFHIYSISPAGEIASALDITDEFTGDDQKPADGDLAIAPDWTRVTYYEDVVTYLNDGKGGEKDDWTATSYCLEGHGYRQCSKVKNASPPNPRNFQFADE
jgi:hypothetical protein